MKHHPSCGTTYMEDCECEAMTNPTPAVEALLDEFDAYCRAKIENCSDRHCMLGENAVGTNGGCNCWDDRNKMRRYLPAARQLHKKIRALLRQPEAVPQSADELADELAEATRKFVKSQRPMDPEIAKALSKVDLFDLYVRSDKPTPKPSGDEACPNCFQPYKCRECHEKEIVASSPEVGIGMWMLRSKSTGEAWTEFEHCMFVSEEDAAVQAAFCNDPNEGTGYEPRDWEPCRVGFVATPNASAAPNTRPAPAAVKLPTCAREFADQHKLAVTEQWCAGFDTLLDAIIHANEGRK